ncbi:Molybdopterin synthase catalytic subunit [Steccherinum ochraceum]|uniref:Molybdopterin synthase catalytic subunit n=1 Tax=Steccherinum ochraceum TaxID=92696 RepID=A0A4R0RZG6_9APHY|nr:Molybdopterin synthase catalytic subunit [Steccherinum ochraceum]
MSEWPIASVEARDEIPEGIAVLTYQELNPDEISRSVEDPRAGATAIFIGTTRNSFKGKTVTRLDYQAYSKLAIKTMTSIICTAHQTYSRSIHQAEGVPVPSVIRSAVYHRLGTVPVGKPSIVIAVSSPHRKEAFQACEFILEKVKQDVQIWKREFYEGDKDDEAEWKSNTAP